MGKPFYKSKTLWVNMLAIVAMIVQMQYGFVFSVEEQVSALAIINVIMRAVTKEELEV